MHLLELTCQEHPGLEVQYGGIGGFIAKKPPKRVDPMKVIQVRWGPRLHSTHIHAEVQFFLQIVPLTISSPNLSEGLFGWTQVASVGFLPQHWQRRDHAGGRSWLQEGGAGGWIHSFSSEECLLTAFNDPCGGKNIWKGINWQLFFFSIKAIEHSTGTAPCRRADWPTWPWQDRGGRLQVSTPCVACVYSQVAYQKSFTELCNVCFLTEKHGMVLQSLALAWSRWSPVSLQGLGRHKEADDEGTAAAAQKGRVPAEEREAEERSHPQDLPERRGGSNAARLHGHVSRRSQAGLQRPSALLRHPFKFMAPHSDVQQSIFCR